MTFPLKQKKICGYKYQQWTWYGVKHRGVDYCANRSLLYAPSDGKIIRQFYGYQGGRWLYFWTDTGYLFKFAHLSEFFHKVGDYIKEGQKLARTGNTGALTTSPHLHMEIWKEKEQKNQINPEEFFKTSLNFVKDMRINREQLEKIYQLAFKRNLDYEAQGYVGRDLDFVLDELLKSKENIYYTRLFKAAKAIEKELP